MEARISIVRVSPRGMTYEILEAVRKAMEFIGGARAYCPKEGSVLIKPNITLPEASACASPSVTYAIAKVFAEAGCKVLLGEDPSIPVSEQETYDQYGMYQLAKQAGAEVVSLRHGPHEMVEIPEGQCFKEIEVSTIAMRVDLIVSVFPLKSINLETIMTGSIKNLKGLIRPAWKRKFHCEGLNWAIVDLFRTVHTKTLALADGTFVTDAARGVMYPLGIIVMGSDPVATDTTCAKIIGINPRDVEHVTIAAQAGLGTSDLNGVDFYGEALDSILGKVEVSPPVDLFEIVAKTAGAVRIVQGNPCSSCLTTIAKILSKYEDRLPRLRKRVIVVGPTAQIPPQEENRAIIVGTCLRKYRHRGIFVDGCPPQEEVYSFAGTGTIESALEQALEEDAAVS